MGIDMIMPFGKYKGKPVSEIPDGYLLYMYDRKKFSGDLKKSVEQNVTILKVINDKKKTK